MQKAIIVGATSGIGEEVALLLAERSWHCKRLHDDVLCRPN